MSDRHGYQQALGTAIKGERERKKLSEGTVATRSGLSEQWLLKVEAGRGNPTWGQLRRLAGAMEVPLPELMERIERCEEEQGAAPASGQESVGEGGKRKCAGSSRPRPRPEVQPQEALAKALSHPLRAEALTILVQRTASPKEIADELDETLPNVSYHVRALEELGLIELVEEEAIRGSVAHFYRAVDQDSASPAWKWTPLLLDEDGWRKVTEIQDSAFVAIRQEQVAAQRRLKRSRRKRVKAIFGLLLFKTALN